MWRAWCRWRWCSFQHFYWNMKVKSFMYQSIWLREGSLNFAIKELRHLPVCIEANLCMHSAWWHTAKCRPFQAMYSATQGLHRLSDKVLEKTIPIQKLHITEEILSWNQAVCKISIWLGNAPLAERGGTWEFDCLVPAQNGMCLRLLYGGQWISPRPSC